MSDATAAATKAAAIRKGNNTYILFVNLKITELRTSPIILRHYYVSYLYFKIKYDSSVVMHTMSPLSDQ